MAHSDMASQRTPSDNSSVNVTLYRSRVMTNEEKEL